MNFAELKEEVIAITRRPDLQEQTDAAIKASILKAHQSDYFYNDLKEIAIEFDDARYIQNFDPKPVMPRYRQVKYIRKWEGVTDPTGVGKLLEQVHLENIFDRYGYAKLDVFYMAGPLLQIRTCEPLKYALFGAYVYPKITPTDELDSWIAIDHPWAIIYEACRTLFLGINFQEQSAGMRSLVAEQYGILSMGNVDSVPT